MRADVVCHAILPLKPLLADGTLKWLLVRVWQLVAVEVIHISESLTTHVTAVILFHWFGGLLRNTLLLLVLHRGHYASACGCWRGGCSENTSYSSNVRRVSVILTGDSGYEWHHGGGCLCLLRPWNHLNASVARLVPPQVVAVPESLVAVATDERRLWFRLLFDHSDWRPTTSPTPSPTGHIVFKKFCSTDRGFLVQGNGEHWFLIRWLCSRIEQRQ